MSIITSQFGSRVGEIVPGRSYWAAKLSTGTWLCELDTRDGRPFDWTRDFIDSGDIRKITELWLFCPQSWASPMGSTAMLRITEPGTAFQLKGANLAMFSDDRTMLYQLIGVVEDKASGACRCHVWDNQMQILMLHWQTNIYHMGSWEYDLDRALGRVPGAHQRIKPIEDISHLVVGLHLD